MLDLIHSHKSTSCKRLMQTLLTFYLYKKNTTVQSYKDVSFDKRTGRSGEYCVHVGENPVCPVDREDEPGQTGAEL